MRPWCSALAALALVMMLTGCTANHYRRSADKEVYSIIRSKSSMVTNMDPNFTIEQTNLTRLDGLPVSTNVAEFLGPDGEREGGARVLSLEEALRAGVLSSRTYQTRKEQLYLSALSLTLTRHDFAPIFSASGNPKYGGETEKVTSSVDEITGETTTSDRLVERQKVSASGSVGASWLIRDVGKLSTSLTADFARFVTGDPQASSSSKLAVSFARPLLRDAGYKKEMEALTQAERQVVYDLRDFTQYRKEFSVGIATAYYNVLGNRDAVRNSYLNLQGSRKNAERSRALAQEGRLSQSDLGRLEQQELDSESAWVNAVRLYQQRLDDFKLQLGLSVDTNLVLDDRELEVLRILDPSLSVDESISIALAARLDYLNAKEKLDDAEREVKLAINLLKPKIDLDSSIEFDSNTDRNTGLQMPDFKHYSWSAGLTVDPGLDLKSERNTYRSALISRNRSSRAIVQLEDEIKQQVRQSWRSLDQARRSYEISEVQVKLGERRVEEQNLRAELGLAKAQDQVDALNALIASKNQRTQALVTHTIARLQFWVNLGILYIKDNGQWQEMQNAKTQ